MTQIENAEPDKWSDHRFLTMFEYMRDRVRQEVAHIIQPVSVRVAIADRSDEEVRVPICKAVEIELVLNVSSYHLIKSYAVETKIVREESVEHQVSDIVVVESDGNSERVIQSEGRGLHTRPSDDTIEVMYNGLHGLSLTSRDSSR